MWFQVGWKVEDGSEVFAGAVVRYGLLERLARSAGERGVTVLAFGLSRREVRLVLGGERADVRNVARGVKVGTTRAVRARGGWLSFGRTRFERADDPAASVAWAHRAPLDAGAPGPLSSVWSSHRDLLGWRHAAFFDAAPLRAAVDPSTVHEALDGGPLPAFRAVPERREPLSLLLRLAAAVRGVLPADRRCFGLFCQVAKARGWPTRDLAEALMLTGRRIRQLYQVDEPLVPVALRALSDPRLCRVP